MSNMFDLKNIAIIAFICICILLIMILRRRANFLLSFLTRVLVGMSGIYFINRFLEAGQIPMAVGWNPVSLLAAGSLGLGGVALLYAVEACKFL